MGEVQPTLGRYGCRSNRPSNLVGDPRDWRRCRGWFGISSLREAASPAGFFAELKLAVPATRITGTFQNNSSDGRSSVHGGLARWGGRRGRSCGEVLCVGQHPSHPHPPTPTTRTKRDVTDSRCAWLTLLIHEPLGTAPPIDGIVFNVGVYVCAGMCTCVHVCGGQP